MKKKDLVSYLDEYLNISAFINIDSSNNGLQIDNEKENVKKIGYAVDASSYIFDKAIKEKVDMVLVHHGMFWGKPTLLTGVNYKRASKLIKNDIALYTSHLPLDAHKVVGNNIGLLNEFIGFFDLKEKQYVIEEYCFEGGQSIGCALRFENEILIEDLKNFTKSLDIKDDIYNYGEKKIINSVAFVSGGGLGSVFEAKEKEYDLLFVGDGKYGEMIYAKELGQSILLGGHYETEKIGPNLLANHLKEMFSIEIVYLDEKF